MRFRRPTRPGPADLLLLLHGWMGNEEVMWIFGQNAPENLLILSPRALNSASGGGYSWTEEVSGQLPAASELVNSADRLHDLVNNQPWQTDLPINRVHLMGFSQGAALAYTYAVKYPDQVGWIAGLAGFVPDGLSNESSERPLAGKTIWIGHGRTDLIVPVERARAGKGRLEALGGQIHYCEGASGHKLSAACFKDLRRFLRNSADFTA
jgi:phospholipase/carboxylesterase